jgi:uncharacterized protein (DUF433 family)
MIDSNLVISDPNIMMGKPVIMGTRITVELILEKLAAGETPAEIIAAHPALTPAAISAALTFTTTKLKAEPLPPTRLIKWLIDKNIISNDKEVTFTGHVLLTVGLLSLIPISYAVLFPIAGLWEDDWINCPKQQLTQQKEPLDRSNLTVNKRLTEQLKAVNELKVKHCLIMTFFYKQYYISLSIASTAALISIVCIFFVSKEGWAKTNNALINVSVTSSVVTLAFLNITQIFQQSQNLKTSQDLYANYTALQNDFLSSLATNQLIVDAKAQDLKNDYKLLIQFTDSRLSSLSLIRLGFDPTPIIDMKSKISSVIDIGNSSTLPKNPGTPPPK